MSRDGGERTRRRFVNETLAALGAGATVGLAGCSGDNGSNSSPTEEEDGGIEVEDDESGDDGVETTTSPDVEHVGLNHWDTYVLAPSDNAGAMMVDSWSPSQFKQAFGVSPIEVSNLNHDDTPAYENVGFSPGDVPETFVQRWENSSYVSGVKIDQLPGTATGQSTASDLRGNGYEKVGEVGEFDIYSKTAAESVHAVSNDFHAFAANILDESTREGMTSQHRNYLEKVLQEDVEDNFELPEEVQLLREALGPRDTFNVVNSEGYEHASPNDKMVGAMTEEYQPSYGATSVDVDEGLKYGAWVFQDSDLAQNVYDRLMSNRVRNNWQNLEVEGRILTAAGQINMESRIENSNFAAEDMTSLPQI